MRGVRAKLSARSRIVIPKEVRGQLGVGPGDSIEFEERGDEVVARAVRRPSTCDPFVAFSEWSSPAGEEAYAGL